MFTSLIVFLVMGILCKNNSYYRDIIHYNLYENSFNFNSVYSFYNKYLGFFSIFDIRDDTNEVFGEGLSYESFEKYKDGIKYNVSNKYLVPSLRNGTVIYIGRKNYYGNVVIVNTTNSINIWYGNICNTSLRLYDYLNKGNYIGESCRDYIYVIYEKGGRFIDYNKYL